MQRKISLSANSNSPRHFKQFLFPSLSKDLCTSFESIAVNGTNHAATAEMEHLLNAFQAEVCPLFPKIDELDERTVLNYSTTDLKQSCVTAAEFFEKILLASTPKNLPAGFLSEGLTKAYVISLNFFNKQLVGSICESSSDTLLKHLSSLSNFAVLTLHDLKNPLMIARYDAVIFQIVSESLEEAYKYFAGMTEVRNIAAATYFFYYQFQTLAVLNSLSETRNFMKNAAHDYIRTSLRIFEGSINRSLSDSLLRKILNHRIGEKELWVAKQHKKLACFFGRKRFSMLHLGPGAPRFSLRYMNLYYISKLNKVVASKKELSLESVAKVFKELSEFIMLKLIDAPSKDYIEVELNETLVCLFIFKQILAGIDQPMRLLESMGCTAIFRGLIESFIDLVLEQKLYDSSIEKDYISEILQIITDFRADKDRRLPKDGSFKGFFLLLGDEIMDSLVDKIDTAEGAPLKWYVIESLFENRQIKSWRRADYVLKLVVTKSIHNTSPKSLRELEVEPWESEANRKIIMILNEVLEFEREWIEESLQTSLEIIRQILDDETALFGIYRLLLCAYKNEVHDNVSFYNLINADFPRDITFDKYLKCRERKEATAVKTFAGIKGIYELADILLQCFTANSTDMIKKMTSSFFMQLVPYFADQIIYDSSILDGLFKNSVKYPELGGIIADLLYVLIKELKYNLELTCKGIFLRKLLTLVRTTRANTVAYFQLLTDSLTSEPGALELSEYQMLLAKSTCLEIMFETVKERIAEPYISTLIVIFMHFMNELRKGNTLIISEMNYSPIVDKMHLLYCLKYLLVRVEFCVTG